MSTITYNHSGDIPSAKPQANSTRRRRRLYLMLLVGGTLLTFALLAGFIPRLQQRQMSAADTSQLAIQSVAVVSPTLVTPGAGLDLPAEVKPWQEASIYSRVNGYLKSWLVDIGAHVEAGQLLAEVDVPDLQHQMDQANSQATLAQKSLEQAKSTNTKYQ